MDESIETIKYEGAKQALFEKISNLLWDAKYCLGEAVQHDGGIYKNFNAKVSQAKRIITEAEELNSELIRMAKKP